MLTKLLHALESQTEENRKEKKKLLLSCLKAFTTVQRKYIHVSHALSIELTKMTLGLSVLSLCARSLLGYKKMLFKVRLYHSKPNISYSIAVNVPLLLSLSPSPTLHLSLFLFPAYSYNVDSNFMLLHR